MTTNNSNKRRPTTMTTRLSTRMDGSRCDHKMHTCFARAETVTEYCRPEILTAVVNTSGQSSRHGPRRAPLGVVGEANQVVVVGYGGQTHYDVTTYYADHRIRRTRPNNKQN